MLDGEIGLTSVQPEPAAQQPAAGEARVQSERSVDHPDRGIDFLAKVPEHMGGVAEDNRIVTGGPKCLPGKIDALATVCFAVDRPTAQIQLKMANTSEG